MVSEAGPARLRPRGCAREAAPRVAIGIIIIIIISIVVIIIIIIEARCKPC